MGPHKATYTRMSGGPTVRTKNDFSCCPPWYTFEHKGCSGENIPNGNSFDAEHFLPEHQRNNLQGPDNGVRCHEFRSLQMMVLVLFLPVECV